jgi:hypothetical protein
MPSQQTYRMTLFKVPNEADQDKLLDLYKAMPQKATKVTTLCVSCHYGPVLNLPSRMVNPISCQ